MAPSNPDVIYVQYTESQFLNLDAIYKSVDGGNSFVLHTKVTRRVYQESALGGFGWYFGKIRVNPSNENDLFLLGLAYTDMMLCLQAGTQFWMMTPQKPMLINTIWSSAEVICIWLPMVACTKVNWMEIRIGKTLKHTCYPILPPAVNPHRPDYFGGAQDNGTSSWQCMDLRGWERIWGGWLSKQLFAR